MFFNSQLFQQHLSHLQVTSGTKFEFMFNRGFDPWISCRIHASYSQQNAYWSADTARLLNLESDATCAPYVALLCPPATEYLTSVPTGAALMPDGCYNVTGVTSIASAFEGSLLPKGLVLMFDTSSVTSFVGTFRNAALMDAPVLLDTSSTRRRGPPLVTLVLRILSQRCIWGMATLHELILSSTRELIDAKEHLESVVEHLSHFSAGHSKRVRRLTRSRDNILEMVESDVQRHSRRSNLNGRPAELLAPYRFAIEKAINITESTHSPLRFESELSCLHLRRQPRHRPRKPPAYAWWSASPSSEC